ncbi:MAG TPA: hypothetical protein VLN26_04630, partial [Gaiellaceae bacterium]|nr:hypothetical protein [Gaiellaceae bacterium]
ESEYGFRHVLIRDVAYGQIPRAARSQKHRRAAAWIESLGRPEDQAEMLAHHYLQALELGEAAGLDVSGLADSARQALREAGDRAAALHAIAAAERFYEAALGLFPDDDPERAQVLYRRAVPGGRHVGGGDPDLLARARDALLAAGDDARAAEVEMLLSQSFWIQGRRDVADDHAARAVALIDGGVTSRSSVYVLTRAAVRASLMGDHARAVELGSKSRAMSEQLGWEEGLSEALQVLGMTRLFVGDRDGLEDVERSVELATRAGTLGNLVRAHNTLAVAHAVLGDLKRAQAARLEGQREAERLGSVPLLRWFEAVFTDHRYLNGEWDEALRRADEFVTAVEAGSPHVLAWQVFAVRAEIRLARGDAAGASGDAERALALAREVAESQAVFITLIVAAHVFASVSGSERATPPARELLDLLARGIPLGFPVVHLPLFAMAATRLGLGDELLRALDLQPESSWTKAAHAYLSGDFAAAAEILQRIGSKPEEAEARLRAAERLSADGRRNEAAEHLRQALGFYRSVGAAAMISECDALDGASA